MAAYLTNTLDTNAKLAVSAALTLTTETVLTLYIFEKTGLSQKHETVLQFSPDGINWLTYPKAVLGAGLLTTDVAAAKVRVCVSKNEGSTSTIDFHIVAK